MENRSLKELYELTLKEYKKEMLLNNVGLCTAMYFIKIENLVTTTEYDSLSHDFEKNMPHTGRLYAWPLADRQSRIEFLENRIKELS